MDGKDWRPKNGGKEVESLNSSSRNRRSIAERRAMSFDFNASGIKTNLKSSAASALMDSPIMLPNTQALISPTTGTFRARPIIHESSSNSLAPTVDGNLADNLSSSCRFNSHTNPFSFPSFSGRKDQSSGGEVHYQTIAPPHLPMDFDYATKFSIEACSQNYACDSAADVKVPNTMMSDIPSDHMPQHKEHTVSENVRRRHIPEEQKGTYPPMGAGRTSEDGYNWRKYGQKQVKGSEHSRSYYKCTYPNCQMKKKVEQSLDGQITEIIYKGYHNHPKPQLSRRSAIGSTFSFNDMSGPGEGLASNVGVEDGSIWRNIQPGSKDNNRADSNWRANVLERTASASSVNEFSNPLSNTQAKSLGIFKSADLSSTSTSQDYGEDGATPGSIPFEDDLDDDDSESKRRSVREPRVVVQVESEFDLLDDGYRWRKYGQKVVKGNPNPRSYYKCTSTGCSVRRHVERASNDARSVITTYEGKHNHEVPAARKSSHGSSSGGNLASATAAAAATQSAPASHWNANVSGPEALLQDLGPHFDIKPEFSDEYMLGNFANDMKFGGSSHYSMQFPPLQNANHYVPFGLDSNNAESYQPGSIAAMATDFPMSLPSSGLAMPANLGPAGFDFSGNGRNLVGQFEKYFMGGQHQLQENEIRFLNPKEKLKDDIGDVNASSSSKIYHPTVGNFPP